ncbi:MAG: type III-A CRISPR-associated RAMP protein Csm3, partial [Deltaproteobacteria bacterium]|nr:type III-A CRISPR-associated RAMP protein Csm3 [Deltaproteobacteria bacterium]
MPDKIKLQGRVFITGEIHALTGLHIGGGAEGVSIGGIDNIVVRDTLTQEPYIPGSSLKGKMRSLSEKLANLPQNQSIGSGVRIHTCEKNEEYQNCHVCHIYGLPGERDFSSP